MRLTEKVAVVTGAGSGIGRAIACAFHREGASLVVADVSGREKETAQTLGERVLAVSVDVSRSDEVREMIARAVSHFGRLDILCNNAGIPSRVARTGEYPEEDFDRVMAVNLRGAFLGMRHGIPALLAAGGGSIVNVASTAGLVAYAGLPAYCAAKAGVIALTKVAAAEYAPEGIRVNALCPGNTKTPLAFGFEGTVGVEAKAATPMGRLARPEEIAEAALFLASSEASFVTGAVLTADGGYTAI